MSVAARSAFRIQVRASSTSPSRPGHVMLFDPFQPCVRPMFSGSIGWCSGLLPESPSSIMRNGLTASILRILSCKVWFDPIAVRIYRCVSGSPLVKRRRAMAAMSRTSQDGFRQRPACSGLFPRIAWSCVFSSNRSDR